MKRKYAWIANAVAALTIALPTVGCAQVDMVNIHATERVVATSRTPEAMPGFSATLSAQPDGVATVSVSTKCGLIPDDQLQIDTSREARNATPGRDWALAGLGAAAIGGGAGVVIDASHTYSSDTNSRTYNPIGPTAAAVTGAVLIAAGLAAGGIVVADLIRSSKSDHIYSTARRRETNISGACSGNPAPGVQISGIIGGGAGVQVAFGRTTASGVLLFDVKQIPATSCFKNCGPNVDIYAEGVLAGTLPLAPAQAEWARQERATRKRIAEAALQREEEVQAAFNSARAKCQIPHTSSDCDELQKWADARPGDPRSVEARSTIQREQSALDDLAWSEARVSDCEQPSSLDACEGVAQYQSEKRGKKRHAEIANRILSAAQPRLNALKRQAAREEKNREDAAARKWDAEAPQRAAQAQAEALRQQQISIDAAAKQQHEDAIKICESSCHNLCVQLQNRTNCEQTCNCPR